jgi:hypothetical protein
MDYMLKTCDDVDFVVTHDDDLRTLFWVRVCSCSGCAPLLSLSGSRIETAFLKI